MPPKAAWIPTWLVLSALMAPRKGGTSRHEEDGDEDSEDDEDVSKDEGRTGKKSKSRAPRATVRRFKYASIPPLVPDPNTQDLEPSIITQWFRDAKEVMQGEELEWIVTAANNIQLDDDTQEYYMTNPDADDEDEKAERLQLEGAGKLTIDDDNVHHVCMILRKNGARLTEYDELLEGEEYSLDLAWKDWNELQKDVVQFNVKMKLALANSRLPEIYEQINRDYGNDSHPLAGLLAWRMVAQRQADAKGDDASYWVIRLQNAVQAGWNSDLCKHPSDLRNWLRIIDEAASNMLSRNQTMATITVMSVPLVLEIISNKKGEEWETWRNLANDMKRTYAKASTSWRAVNRALQKEITNKFGTQTVAAIVSATPKVDGGRGTDGEPQGVALAAMKHSVTTYEQFQRASMGLPIFNNSNEQPVDSEGSGQAPGPRADNASEQDKEPEVHTSFWAQSGQGNDFCLAAVASERASAPVMGINAMPVSQVPTMCAGCLCPVPDDGSGECLCDECAETARLRGPRRDNIARRGTSALTTSTMMAIAAGVAAAAAWRVASANAPMAPNTMRSAGTALAIAMMAARAGIACGKLLSPHYRP